MRSKGTRRSRKVNFSKFQKRKTNNSKEKIIIEDAAQNIIINETTSQKSSGSHVQLSSIKLKKPGHTKTTSIDLGEQNNQSKSPLTKHMHSSETLEAKSEILSLSLSPDNNMKNQIRSQKFKFPAENEHDFIYLGLNDAERAKKRLDYFNKLSEEFKISPHFVTNKNNGIKVQKLWESGRIKHFDTIWKEISEQIPKIYEKVHEITIAKTGTEKNPNKKKQNRRKSGLSELFGSNRKIRNNIKSSQNSTITFNSCFEEMNGNIKNHRKLDRKIFGAVVSKKFGLKITNDMMKA